MPESWANDAQRRREAGIPEGIVFRRKWELALEIIDQIREWGLPDRVALGDAGYGDGTEFREAPKKRKLKYAVGVLPQVGVWLKPPKITPPKLPAEAPSTAARYGHQRPTTAQEAARQARGWRTIRWREGTRGWLESRFWAARVQPSHRYQDGRPPGKEVWLLAEWPESEKAPIKYCLCDLSPADYALRRIVRPVKCRWKIEQDYHQLKEELGLDHYEGRNWQGWHHHVTMVMVAHAFLTLETLRGKKTSGWDPAEDATQIQYIRFTWTGVCAIMPQQEPKSITLNVVILAA